MTAQGEAADVWQLIERQPVAMFTTGIDGGLVSRPMYSLVRPEEGRIYFVSRLDTDKIGEVGGSAPVNLAYVNPGKNEYVSVAGTAQISADREKLRELWSFFAEAWLPQGPDDPNVVLITVTPQDAKFWDGTSSRILEAFKMLKAVATQTPPDGAKVREVTM